MCKNCVFCSERSTGLANAARFLLDKIAYFCNKFFDGEDIDRIMAQLEGVEHHNRVIAVGYFLTSREVGFAAIDCDQIKDPITKSTIYEIVPDLSPDFMFGSGIYGGGLFEKQICPLLDYVPVE